MDDGVRPFNTIEPLELPQPTGLMYEALVITGTGSITIDVALAGDMQLPVVAVIRSEYDPAFAGVILGITGLASVLVNPLGPVQA